MPSRAGLRTRTRTSANRLRNSAIPLVQCALAAGISWWVAFDLLGHSRPFFAPIAAVISLGVSLGARLRRSVEMVVGVTVGIGVGDVIIIAIGTGPWQIAVVVGLAMAAAILLDAGPIIPIQAASSAVLVATLLPPGDAAGYERMLDALVGGLVGIAVVALVPTHPVRRARRQGAEILGVMADVLRKTADGLIEQDPAPILAALKRARATQSQLDSMRADLQGGREISRISPLYWGSRQRLERLTATADPLDNAVRNIRVLVRRSLSLVRDDEILDARLVDEIEKLSHAVEVLRQMMLAEPGEQPDQAAAARVLRSVAIGARPELVEGAGLSAHVVFGQLRSTVVDLLQVAGLNRISAIALLPPTVAHPYVPPQL
ncbi:MAG: aromatic acid exporter family protein [Aldersonia sp.]|nr:aromatic acid exporter family protein [Aldersonia sp.]